MHCSKTEPFLSNFIRKLTQLLHNKENSKIVEWMPNGIGFKIKDIEKFTVQILPNYYRHANMPSFVRQLNMYGFHKIKDGDQSYYHHQYFCKDEPQLLFKISRKPEKKTFCQNGVINEKQNSLSSAKQTISNEIKRNKKRQVSFEQNIKEKKEEPERRPFNAMEMMSNISIKYQQCEKNNESLFGPGLSCLDLLKDFEGDNVSIGPVSEYNIPRAEQFMKSTHKMIIWQAEQGQKQEMFIEN